MRVSLGVLSVISMWMAQAVAGSDVAWQVADAPYRAVVRAQSAPKSPDAGFAIVMPEFGATAANNTDLLLLDSAGKPQPLATIWRMDGQTITILAKGLRPKEDYYLYFGGGKSRRSPTWQPKTSVLMETRRLPQSAHFDSWTEMESIWRRATVVDGGGLMPAIYHAINPYGESQNFCTHYSGYLLTGNRKSVYLYTQSCDASFVVVNGKYAFGWPGKHQAHANEKTVVGKTVDCSSDGLTQIDYYHAKASDGAPSMMLGWRDSGKLRPLKADDWLHPATADVDRIEDIANRPLPLPQFGIDSYIGFNDYWLFETKCFVSAKGFDGWTAQWSFDDGGKFDGREVKRALVGMSPIRVTVRLAKGKETLTGIQRLDFAETYVQASVNEPKDTERYLTLLRKEIPSQLVPKALRAGVHFTRQFGSEQDAARYADAYLARNPDPTERTWITAIISHTRALSQIDPKRALEDLRRVTGDIRKRYATQLDLLEMDLLVFFLRDPSIVSRAPQIAMAHQGTLVGKLAPIRVGDFYRLTGKQKEAVEAYTSSQKAIPDESGGRKLPAQDRAFSIAVTEMMAAGYRQEVEDKLLEWETEHPLAKLDSDFLLQRARFLLTLGRWREALTELDSFEKIQPDSPYQIDVNFNRARALYELGQKDDAKKLWKEIATKYPRHSLADQAKQWAGKP